MIAFPDKENLTSVAYLDWEAQQETRYEYVNLWIGSLSQDRELPQG
ncbi:hypothetical protein [Leptolyngbya sp. 'hensonii']|nr:hypothetical protein [Leptolyngbya sp. 'hensonii']